MEERNVHESVGSLQRWRPVVGTAILLAGVGVVLWPFVSQIPYRIAMKRSAEAQMESLCGTELGAQRTPFINPYMASWHQAGLPARQRGQRFAEQFVLVIPKIGLKVPVHNSLSADALNAAAAHDPATAMPGQEGTGLIMAHRNVKGAAFWSLGSLDLNDSVICYTCYGTFVYRIRKTAYVSDLSGVEAEEAGAWLVLLTCHPPVQPKGFLAVLCRLEKKQTSPDQEAFDARPQYPTSELPWLQPYAHGSCVVP